MKTNTVLVWLCIAMDTEWEALQQHGIGKGTMELVQESPYSIYQGMNGRLGVIITGIGTANSAAAFQYLVGTYPMAEAYVNVGVAGGVHPSMKVGSAYMASGACFFDVDVTTFGYTYGQLPGKGLPLYQVSTTEDYHYICASGNSFVADFQKVYQERIPREVHMVDMEAAGMLHIAYINHALDRCRVVKGISDNASENANKEYAENFAIAMEAVAIKLTNELLPKYL